MTTASDSFTRADETPLAGDWETVDGGGMDLFSNACRTNGFSTWDASSWKATTNDFGDNQFSQATFTVLSDFDEVGVIVRATTNNYYLFASDGNTTAAGNRLIRVVAGTPTTITSYGTNIADGSVVKLDVNGTALKVYDDTVEIISTTDANISTGQPGIAGFSDGSKISRVDTWSADDGAGGAVTTRRYSLTLTGVG